MSEDFPSSNPFRRKFGDAAPTVAESTPGLILSDDLFSPTASSFDPPSSRSSEPFKVQPKTQKKVRVQSPPPSSPEDISISRKPPTPIPRDDELPSTTNDPFNSSPSDMSEASDDDTTTVKNSYTPANPFQKTLATLEQTNGTQDTLPLAASSGQKAGRASLDVDAFKRLLLTGSAGQRTGASGQMGNTVTSNLPSKISNVPSTNIPHHAFNDGTSTDTSSVSKQSLFEPIQGNHPESPRTSQEVSDPDDERRGLGAESSSKPDRKKPLPPSSKHGKLIRIELRDNSQMSGLESPVHLGTKRSQQSLSSRSSFQSASPTDLNKPLPAAPIKPLPAAPPRRASHESDQESIFDVEAAGKRPEPPSPSASVRRKTAPAPPISRRHSQLILDSKFVAAPTGRLSPNFEEPQNFVDSTLQPLSRAPPPPPSRRPASIRNSSYDLPAVSPTFSALDLEKNEKSLAPAPPPTRKASKRLSGRPPSAHSLEPSSKRLSAVPPPPPPRQRASSKTSIEGPASPGPSSTSDEFFRRSEEGTRRRSQGSYASQPDQMESVKKDGAVGANDILADLAALQREVDALRGIHGRGSES